MSGPKREHAAASFAGVGAGTDVLGLAHYIPDQYVAYKNILVYCSPWLTVGVRFIYAMLASEISNKITKIKLNNALKEATEMRDRVVADPNASEKHKKDAIENVERLEKLKMEVIQSDVMHVRAILKEIPG